MAGERASSAVCSSPPAPGSANGVACEPPSKSASWSATAPALNSDANCGPSTTSATAASSSGRRAASSGVCAIARVVIRETISSRTSSCSSVAVARAANARESSSVCRA